MVCNICPRLDLDIGTLEIAQIRGPKLTVVNIKNKGSSFIQHHKCQSLNL